MTSFLSIVAADMLAHFSHNMRDVTVCFPGKRAGMFLNRELALQSNAPIWAPRYCIMADLFQELTPVRVADPLECICQLYDVMQEVLGSEYTETLDEFWSWGEVLMADFDDIDKQLANAKAIFTNIADREQLKRTDFLDQHQREVLTRFFGRFSLENSTRLQERFLHTWSRMYDIYSLLRERMLAEGKLWEGALFRLVAEQMKADDNLVQKLLEGRRAIVFAGFNALVAAEHTMMKRIQREGKARFYWDYDVCYVHSQSDLEAGTFMKQNLRDFPCAIEDAEAFDNFSRLEDVTFVSCTTDAAAARYAAGWIHDTAQAKALPPGNMVEGEASGAIVLCNESLMLPCLHAMPEASGDVNVTMGFPISSTPVCGILLSLLRLQIEGYDTQRHLFRHSFVQTLRQQPLFALLAQQECLEYKGNSSEALLDYLLTHLRQLALHFAGIEEPNVFEQLQSEAARRTDQILCLLRDHLLRSEHPLCVRPATLRRLLRQMMEYARIPFHSEPDRGMQMMGMLETRCLDFEHVLLLSAEEGYLPRSTHAGSFIPESLREAFGLTTQHHRTAIYAYYFFRLVQRCRHLTCVYNESQGGGAGHEMSRFLLQMLAETDIPIRHRWLQSLPKVRCSSLATAQKTPEVMHSLRLRYDQNLTEGQHLTISPSALASYMACPMQFYLDHVLHIRREDEPQEGIAPNVIGDIFHDTAALFYEWLTSPSSSSTNGRDPAPGLVTASMLCSRSANGTLLIRPAVFRQLTLILHAAFEVCFFHPADVFDRMPLLRRRLKQQKGGSSQTHGEYKGTTLIAHDVLLHYLCQLIRYDAAHAPFRIVGMEVERTITCLAGGISVKVGGRIDRIDEMDGRLRIVDYKTGSPRTMKENVTMADVILPSPLHNRYYMQTFLYALCSLDAQVANRHMPIKPVLFYPGKAALADYDPSLSIDGRIVDDFASQCADQFRRGLEAILSDIFDPTKPFSCTTDAKACAHCKLSLLCGKHLS